MQWSMEPVFCYSQLKRSRPICTFQTTSTPPSSAVSSYFEFGLNSIIVIFELCFFS